MLDSDYLIKEIGKSFKSRRLWLVTAESCTGGLLGHMITSAAGASEFYLGGIITYSNNSKEKWLGVASATLKQYGAVSMETVMEMARGVRTKFADQYQAENIIGVSISGIAGPGGGTPVKPVGTVWIGVISASRDEAFEFHFKGDRGEIKTQASLKALELLLNHLR